jgi:hypothetical protein
VLIELLYIEICHYINNLLIVRNYILVGAFK